MLSWIELNCLANEYSHFSCKPTTKRKYPPNFVFDADKSVNWNAAEVKRLNAEFEEEVANLNRKKNLLYKKFIDAVFARICDDVGHGINKEAAKVIYDTAYAEHHSSSLNEVLTYAREYAEMVRKVLDLRYS